ncbi:lysoplasmalogenase [Curvibacter sp. APW13]|uniref:lysoplasmalogenase n=1 Tax=Curvibacter sp. APW13 TaxID=3077236 RepID=UPI0028DFF5D3|nr:lysoplasmalogenase [Curvibacter sp. APW13]MDT8992989.1 lysoplasmalogenase [Curvibacter sp. APW13]
MTDTIATLLYLLAAATIAWGGWLWRSGRIAALQWALIAASSLATLSSLKLLDLHLVLKPIPMAVAMLFVAVRAHSAGGLARNDLLLLAALLFSLGGDVFLMLPGNYFIPGLASFLVAHLFYIALFRQGMPWFASRRGLIAVLGFGATMYAILWSHLPDPVLAGAVGAYVTVISLMASQAIGRAKVLGTRDARWVAVGTCIFMASDSLIAVNKFLTPIPLESLWILITYFAAQFLIVHFMPAGRKAA